MNNTQNNKSGNTRMLPFPVIVAACLTLPGKCASSEYLIVDIIAFHSIETLIRFLYHLAIVIYICIY